MGSTLMAWAAGPELARTLDEAQSQTELMRRVARGDEAALREVGTLYMRRVVRLAQRLLGSASDADDIAQETLVRVWQSAGSFDAGRAGLGTWITTIGYRLCLDRLRASSSRGHAVDLEEAPEAVDGAPGIVDVLIHRQELARLHRALHALPARQRAAFLLFYLDEQRGPDCARIMGLRPRAFWSLLHRARSAVENARALTEDPPGKSS
jgi:RNA polymerase sigma-70 factor (ECF subfamily)